MNGSSERINASGLQAAYRLFGFQFLSDLGAEPSLLGELSLADKAGRDLERFEAGNGKAQELLDAVRRRLEQR